MNRYQQIYELLTPIIISGRMTTGESASLLALVSLAEKEAFERGLNTADEMKTEHLQLDENANKGETFYNPEIK